ncbi:MAG: class I SAM-dependent methyltransferase [Chitinophagaceae bacterium]|nr:class I SAM-dependent methyltransferase [Anaerolineae bacterium]
MDATTIQRLNAINREFYRVTADEFDQTRGTAWPGWEKLLPYLNRKPNGTTFSVLDVGCGNGRFGVFLAEHVGRELDYHGMDNNGALLERAMQAVSAAPGVATTLERRDVVEDPPDSGLYDLVAVFGVIHHIPGCRQRQEFIRMLAKRVKPGGVLALACWRFYEFDRFRSRIIPWGDDLRDVVENHDYLLDWRRGEVALRYCHYVDDAEHAALLKASGLDEIVTYRADGFTGTVNQYSILVRLD